MSPETVFLNLWHTAVRANCGDQLVSSPGVVRHKVIRAECEHTAVGSLVGSHQPCQHQSEVEVGGRQAAPSPTSLVLGRCVPGDVFRCWIAEPGQNGPRVQLVLVTVEEKVVVGEAVPRLLSQRDLGAAQSCSDLGAVTEAGGSHSQLRRGGTAFRGKTFPCCGQCCGSGPVLVDQCSPAVHFTAPCADLVLLGFPAQ
jgi:hypothetical protein